jgi:hypothetical protein
MSLAQLRERVHVAVLGVALPPRRVPAAIGNEAEPVEVFDQRALVVDAAADAIVILQSQQYLATCRPGDAPDVNGVHDVAEMQVPCW